MSVLVLAPLAGAFVLAIILLAAASARGAERTGLDRGALRARWVGVGAAAVVAALFVAATGPLGALLLAAPVFAAAAAAAVIGLGDAIIPAPTGGQRIGLLAPRALGTLAPRTAAVTAAVTAAALIGLSALTAATASPDDRGRAGRVFAWDNGVAGVGGMSGTHGPFPGLWYTGSLWIALGILAVAAGAALTVVIRRRPTSDPADILARRRAVTAVLGVSAAGISCSLLGCAVFASAAYREAALHWGTWRSTTAVLGFWASIAAALVAVAGIVLGVALATAPALVAPGRRDERAGRRADTVTAGKAL